MNAVEDALTRATAEVADNGDGWETTAAVLAYEVRRLQGEVELAMRMHDVQWSRANRAEQEAEQFCEQFHDERALRLETAIELDALRENLRSVLDGSGL
ncbi:hypothetical protein J2X46_002718 [Nocardioides sp. BE266]|uniref:hypothetical protein n=1 Tax=Nocardioides sp. BE266 TaxID=2817725 RepID=UPI00285CCF2B|nr:hypothetical protein [Nocardioides sp. BE266]MDR7253728.1 hypothetical protein [Nocardioides sp. BE266]